MGWLLYHQVTVGDLALLWGVVVLWRGLRAFRRVIVSDESTDGGEARRRIEAQDAAIRAQAEQDRRAG